jgi:hypothetical protein
MSETNSITAIYLGFLLFVAWVFFMTTSPWAFALLVFTPTVKTSKEGKNIEGKKENKKIENKIPTTKLIKNE